MADAAPAVLTHEQLAQYREQGFTVVPGLLAPGELERLRAELEDLVRRAPAGRGSALDAQGEAVPGGAVYFNFTDPAAGDDPRTFNATNCKTTLNRVNQMFKFAPRALQAAGSPRLLGAVQDIYGPGFVPFGESYVVKAPGDGAGFAWHQDTGISVDFPYPWQPERGINLGIYLHDSTVDNGCLMVVPGSHGSKVDMAATAPPRGGVYPGAVTATCRAGDVIIHARNVVHGSMPNTSGGTRATLYLGFLPHASCATLHTEEDVAARQALVPACYVAARAACADYAAEAPFVYAGLTEEQVAQATAGGVDLLDRSAYPLLQI